MRRANVGAHRNVHANEPSRARKHSTKHKADNRNDTEENTHKRRNDDTDDRNRAILARQISLRAFLNCGADFDHLGIAGRGAEHLAAGDNAVKYGGKTAQNGDQNEIHGYPSLQHERAAWPRTHFGRAYRGAAHPKATLLTVLPAKAFRQRHNSGRIVQFKA